MCVTLRADSSRVTITVKPRREGGRGETDAASTRPTVTGAGLKPEVGRTENSLPLLEGLDGL